MYFLDIPTEARQNHNLVCNFVQRFSLLFSRCSPTLDLTLHFHRRSPNFDSSLCRLLLPVLTKVHRRFNPCANADHDPSPNPVALLATAFEEGGRREQDIQKWQHNLPGNAPKNISILFHIIRRKLVKPTKTFQTKFKKIIMIRK